MIKVFWLVRRIDDVFEILDTSKGPGPTSIHIKTIDLKKEGLLPGQALEQGLNYLEENGYQIISVLDRDSRDTLIVITRTR